MMLRAGCGRLIQPTIGAPMQFALEVLISTYIITLWLSALSQKRHFATSPAHPGRRFSAY
jgi:hypothetical protein